MTIMTREGRCVVVVYIISPKMTKHRGECDRSIDSLPAWIDLQFVTLTAFGMDQWSLRVTARNGMTHAGMQQDDEDNNMGLRCLISAASLSQNPFVRTPRESVIINGLDLAAVAAVAVAKWIRRRRRRVPQLSGQDGQYHMDRLLLHLLYYWHMKDETN